MKCQIGLLIIRLDKLLASWDVFPLEFTTLSFTWKIAPALATGNCVIAKPSELSPTTAYLLGKICQEAGLPDGVLNIIHGYGTEAGEAMIQHPEIKAISFTGGTKRETTLPLR